MRKEQEHIKFPPLNEGDEVRVQRYSGQVWQAHITGWLPKGGWNHCALINFGLAGLRELYLFDDPKSGKSRAGTFKERSMRDWSVDIGTLERLRNGFQARPRTVKK